MISVSAEAMRERAENWARTLKTGEVCSSESTLGGGSLPGESLPTYVLSLGVAAATSLLEKLRRQDPPIIARAERGRILLDPRTVQPEDDRILLGSLAALLAEAV
jgi:L-seryl-tRNA(Ser) seleniumtransferase